MAQVVWTEPALADLDAIADYIALDNTEAARRLVQGVFKHVEQLERHPKSGSVPAELRASRYRQIVEPPCRVFYRFDGKRVWILHVMRSERLFRPGPASAAGPENSTGQGRVNRLAQRARRTQRNSVEKMRSGF